MKQKKTVALVEPSYYGLGYINAACSRGHKLIAIVSSKNNPAKYGYEGKYADLIEADIRDSDSIITAIKSSPYLGKIDALIPATDYASHITSSVSKYFGLPRTPYATAFAARRKDIARGIYEKAGLLNPKFAKVTSLGGAKKTADQIGYPLVVKPTDCASSQNVFLVKNDGELSTAMETLLSFHETYLGFKTCGEILVEEFITGPEFSVEIFVHNGEISFASVTEKMTTPPPYFAEIVHTVPTSIYKDREGDIISTATKAILALGFRNGACHVELKLSLRGPVIIETNGRPGGDQITSDLLVNAFGINFFGATIDSYLGDFVGLNPTNNLSSSIAYLIAPHKGRIKAVKNIENINNQSNVVKSAISVKPGDTVRPPQSSDDRLGYVITVASTPEKAKTSAIKAIQSLELEYEKIGS